MNCLGAGNMVSKFVKHVKRVKAVAESAGLEFCLALKFHIHKYIPACENIFFFKTLVTRVQLSLVLS